MPSARGAALLRRRAARRHAAGPAGRPARASGAVGRRGARRGGGPRDRPAASVSAETPSCGRGSPRSRRTSASSSPTGRSCRPRSCPCRASDSSTSTPRSCRDTAAPLRCRPRCSRATWRPASSRCGSWTSSTRAPCISRAASRSARPTTRACCPTGSRAKARPCSSRLCGPSNAARSRRCRREGTPTFSRPLRREDGEVELERTGGGHRADAARVLRRGRASIPFWDRSASSCWRPTPPAPTSPLSPGELGGEGDRVLVGAGAGTALSLRRVQREGRTPMSGAEFHRGLAKPPGRLGRRPDGA